VNIPNPPV
jgi:hypothetical protein